MPPERKLVAILAADVAGYSRLIGADEEGTLRRLKAHRTELIAPKVAEYHGRIVKLMGDGILIEFQSAVAALRCAVEIQRSAAERDASETENQRIKFRLGLHQGDIVVEDGDIFGDGVNVAARLEALADPGGICVSQRIHEDAIGKANVVFEDMGEQQLKNIARPVRVYRVWHDKIPRDERPARASPSINVLPLHNTGGDPEQAHFGNNVVEEIITALSRLQELLLFARNSRLARDSCAEIGFIDRALIAQRDARVGMVLRRAHQSMTPRTGRSHRGIRARDVSVSPKKLAQIRKRDAKTTKTT